MLKTRLDEHLSSSSKPLKNHQKSSKTASGPKIFFACGALEGASPRGPCLTAQNRLPWASPSYPSPPTPRRHPGGERAHEWRRPAWSAVKEGRHTPPGTSRAGARMWKVRRVPCSPYARFSFFTHVFYDQLSCFYVLKTLHMVNKVAV